MRTILFLLLLSMLVYGQTIVVVADKNFPYSSLTRDKIKSFFLNKKSFIKKQNVLVMNHEYGENIRTCFEKVILHKTKKSLERYWRKAYYQGQRPPKVVKSTAMLLSYLQHVTPAMGYMDESELSSKEVVILYRSECP